MSTTITLDEIKARCEEVGECWLWQGATSDNGYPIMKRGGGPCLLVRRVVADIKGTPPAARQPVVVTCGEKCCCNPAHVRFSTVKKVAEAAAKAGAYSSIDRCAKVAKARRIAPGAKLDEGKARDIRLSAKTSAALATEYGVSLSLIKSIRAGRAWKDYASPFARLGARPQQARQPLARGASV